MIILITSCLVPSLLSSVRTYVYNNSNKYLTLTSSGTEIILGGGRGSGVFEVSFSFRGLSAEAKVT